MADAALGDFPRVALELVGGDIVVGVDLGRPFRVGAAVAGFAGHAAVCLTEAEEGVGVFRKALVGRHERSGGRIVGIVGQLADEAGPQMAEDVAGMAGLALGQVCPGPSLLAGGGQVDPNDVVVNVREVGIHESILPQLRSEAAHRQQFAVTARHCMPLTAMTLRRHWVSLPGWQ